MQAMIIRQYGEPEAFERAELPDPAAGEGEVVVRVRGSSVNPVDAGIRAGMLSGFLPLALPAVLGVDVAGEVEAVGPGVTRFAPGDRVFAFTGIGRGGGYGERVALPEEMLGRVPEGLSWAEAGVVPGAGVTAHEAFVVHAPLQPGMRVLVNGAAGGVGTFAVQEARALGAEVVGTCSPAKAELVLGLGADRVIDYTVPGALSAEADRYDVVLNCVRGAPTDALLALVRSGGTLVSVTDTIGRSVQDGKHFVAFAVQTSGALLDGLAELIGAGRVRPVIERVYGWRELPEAHHRVQTGRVTGKLAVVPDGP